METLACGAARRPRSTAEMLASACRASGAAGLVDTGNVKWINFRLAGLADCPVFVF